MDTTIRNLKLQTGLRAGDPRRLLDEARELRARTLAGLVRGFAAAARAQLGGLAPLHRPTAGHPAH